MNARHVVAGLTQLVAMRAKEVDRLEIDVAARDAEGARYRHHISQMTLLMQSVDTGTHVHPEHAMNGARYRSALANLIHLHQHQLAKHEALVAGLRADLCRARLRYEQIDRVRSRKLGALELEKRARDRKLEDQQASQAWLRRRLSQQRSISNPF
ncbi:MULTISPECIES: hypothetical protein [Burkholderia]|uniref:hypothetical protein n=1 Tax=Burkholderia TaxID=32008 RepID=UPI0006788B0F|nr:MULTISPECIES: hypothetical protein [Burkholderia]KWU25541.1 hypothetical protein AS149_29525 [Burkholderia cenocepacia]MCA7972870.1 hypothetical protein [Burkholderia sp. AU39826]QRR18562.1 hypothetical protein GJG85_34900 [Burkholderia sp. MS389]CAG2378194.1 ATPase involved in DNA repair [Burkholderia cenocepacia]CAG2378290.1 ATPase involved in DNA repair [Burkholderia cenocepacia]